MVLGWRRAFCTSISKEQKQDSTTIKETEDPVPSPGLRSRFGGFFSNPSTPRLETQPVSSPILRCRTTVTPPEPPTTAAVPYNSAPESIKLRCETRSSPRFFNRSTPSSPRSPSTFSLLKSSLRLTKQSRCRICSQATKAGEGTAIFTAECGHSFHFPCISTYIKKQGSLDCPVCSSPWKEMHLLNTESFKKFYQDQKRRYSSEAKGFSNPKNSERRCILKVYNDDEPLPSPACCAHFNPIPEFDETEDESDEFPGFYGSSDVKGRKEMRCVEIAFSTEVALVSVGKTSETYALGLKIRAPAAPVRGTAVDLVTVLDVSRGVTGEKLHLMKRAMRLVVSSLSTADRLSIVAFSATSKRLLPLRRMTAAGKKSARAIIDAVGALDCAAASTNDSLKKAAKILEDRREKNHSASVILFADGHGSDPIVSSSRVKVPVHSFSLGACVNVPLDSVAKCINSVISTSVQDLEIQLSAAPGSPPFDIPAVYLYAGRPAYIGSGSGWNLVGDFHSEEEKEMLVELKVIPPLIAGARRFLSVQCSYNDPSTLQRVHDKERSLPIPHPRASRSSSRETKRLKCLFVTTRAVAESKRMVERNDVAGAIHMLASARVLVAKCSEEFVRVLESELSELNILRQENQTQQRRKNSHDREGGADPITPTSAWRTAERLAKVAIMKKSLNRVSDLHGFEDARF